MSRPLYHIFTRIPDCYDLINRVITFGMDVGWRQQAALVCLQDRPGRILDLCCGTGDLSVTIARLADYRPEITGVDYSQPMLEIATAKAGALNQGSNIRFINADVDRLPFSDGYFDCIGISFAFRNLTYRNPNTQSYLDEILRVLRPGGRFVIVESSQPKSAFIRFFHHLYLRAWVFPSGYLLSGIKPPTATWRNQHCITIQPKSYRSSSSNRVSNSLPPNDFSSGLRQFTQL